MCARPATGHNCIDSVQSTKLLVESLCTSLSRGAKTRPVKVIETHISHLLLAGDYAYKIKKPIDLGFLNFTTIEKRRFYCQEELRLNRRLAPGFYLDLVSITGSVQRPKLGGRGSPIEYAVKMRRFDEAKQLDLLAHTEELTFAHMDRLACDLANFHHRIEVASVKSHFSNPDVLHERTTHNFNELATYKDPSDTLVKLRDLRHWTETSLAEHSEQFQCRKQQGYVRECHGDLHLSNMFLDADHVVVFDCLEFNEDLRWIDVMSDLAFLIMDLDYRQRMDLSHHVLSKYLEYSGDYDGLFVLTHYLVYRALVRAKVAWIRQKQIVAEEEALSSNRSQEVEDYIELALKYTQMHPSTPVIITHGVSGSGKSHVSETLAERIGAIQIRSDVERKRMRNMTSADTNSDGINQGAYTPGAIHQVYTRLLVLAKIIIQCGYPVVVDATFLTREQRSPFQDLARQLRVPFKILEVQAPYSVLKDRVNRRLKQGDDPSEATVEVLDHQLKLRETLIPEELPVSVLIDTSKTMDIDRLSTQLLKEVVY